MSSPITVGSLTLGANLPIRVQSMTNTDTADINTTVEQILLLAHAGSELVRITIDREDSAKAVPYIIEKVRKHSQTPIVGDFHFNGDRLLTKYPTMAKALDKYRINPGNIGRGNKRDIHFETILSLAQKYNKPIRIGINGGSVDPSIMTEVMNENTEKNLTKTDTELLEQGVMESALCSLHFALDFGVPENRILLSAKLSNVQSTIRVYRTLAQKTNVALHIGLTEAGGGVQGIVSSSIALGVLLAEGIGDTIRVSLTPRVGESRVKEVLVAQEILQSLGIRYFRPRITSCPGCGRTSGNAFEKVAEDLRNIVDERLEEWKKKWTEVDTLHIAVMGCIVNGVGEASNADIGIFFPGKGEGDYAVVYENGVKKCDLRGNVVKKFVELLEKYVNMRSEK